MSILQKGDKMKKLNLNETWEQCLKMWRWIVRQPCPRNIYTLKDTWLKEHGFGNNFLYNDCFFCDYNCVSCKKCPGYKVDRDFHCENYEYNYSAKPTAFLRKITELNKKRLSKKAKKEKK